MLPKNCFLFLYKVILSICYRTLILITYVYRGIKRLSLNQNIIVTLSPGRAGVISQGSSASLPGTAQIIFACTETKEK